MMQASLDNETSRADGPQDESLAIGDAASGTLAQGYASSAHRTLLDLLRHGAAVRRDDPAIGALGAPAMSHGELLALTGYVHGVLSGLDLASDSRIALVLPQGPVAATAFLAVAAVAECAPLNPAYGLKELEFSLIDLKVKAVIVPGDRVGELRPLAEKHAIRILEIAAAESGVAGDFILNGIPRAESGGAPSARRGDDIALVLHTSGTTSRPKIVPLRQAQICASAANIAASLQLDRNDTALGVMPLFHIHGLIASLLAVLHSGGRVVYVPRFEPRSFAEWLVGTRATWFTAVPTILQAILKHGQNLDTGKLSLRFIRSSSAPLPATVFDELERAFGVPVIEAYGMTEAAHQISSNPLPPGRRKSGSVGITTVLQATTLSPDGKPLPKGEQGEIALRGPTLFTEYENNVRANSEAFVDGWFRTGDVGRIDADGYIRIEGRLKEIINRGGEKIAPREVEDVLLEHAEIDQAAAFPVPHTTLGEDIAATVVLRQGSNLSEEAIRAYLARAIAEFKVPQRIIVVDEIPKGPTGKVQRLALAKLLEFALVPEVVPPRDERERALARVWSEVLGRPQESIGIYDNFFALGGDSIAAITVAGKARVAGLALTPRDISLRPTIAALAEAAATNVAVTEQQPVAGRFELGAAAKLLLEVCGGHLAEVMCLSLVLEARGPLDRAAVAAALTRVVNHHDGLRARFLMSSDGERRWTGEILPPFTDVPVHHVDLSREANGKQEVLLARVREAFGRVSEKALSGVPPTEFLTVEMGPGEPWGVLMLIHHMVADQFSLRILQEDFSFLYARIVQGDRTAELPLKSTSSLHAARRERETLDETKPEDLEYWLSERNVEALPISATSEVAHARIEFLPSMLPPADTTAIVTGTAAKYRVEPVDVLATAYGLALRDWIHSSSPDIVMNVAMTGRTTVPEDVDLSRTIGCFAHAVPVVVAIDESQAKGDLIRSVAKQLRSVPKQGSEFLKHAMSGTPMAERLLKPWGVEYVGRRIPLFNYVGAAQSPAQSGLGVPTFVSKTDWRIGGLACVDGMQTSANAGMGVSLVLVHGALIALFSWGKDVFPRESIMALSEAYVQRLRWLGH